MEVQDEKPERGADRSIYYESRPIHYEVTMKRVPCTMNRVPFSLIIEVAHSSRRMEVDGNSERGVTMTRVLLLWIAFHLL